MIKHCLFLVSCFLLFASGAFAQENLTLEKVTVLSRHGVRAPLEKYLQDLDEVVPPEYTWTRWSVEGSHLTLKGGALEMLFGEYFRLWLARERFSLDSADVYFGASSKQRTVATARAFSAGMLPDMTVPVDYKTREDGSIGYLDPDYLPLLNCRSTTPFDTTAFKQEAFRELAQFRAPSYQFLEQVLRFKRSKRARTTGSPHFNSDISVILDFYKHGDRQEPVMRGDLNVANRASDALILQYYEAKDLRAAAFGRRLSFADWQKLAHIKSCYDDILFTTPIVAVNVSHCLLERLQAEMLPSGHKFAFFCSHDTMILAVLKALRVKEYTLQGTIEERSPIGFKFLLEQWADESGRRYVRPRLVYQSSEQVRNLEILDLNHPPMSCELEFEGLEKAASGMYPYGLFMQHLQASIESYQATARGRNPFEA